MNWGEKKCSGSTICQDRDFCVRESFYTHLSLSTHIAKAVSKQVVSWLVLGPSYLETPSRLV